LQSRCKAHIRLSGYEFVGIVIAEERFTGAMMVTVIVQFEQVSVAPSTPLAGRVCVESNLPNVGFEFISY